MSKDYARVHVFPEGRFQVASRRMRSEVFKKGDHLTSKKSVTGRGSCATIVFVDMRELTSSTGAKEWKAIVRSWPKMGQEREMQPYTLLRMYLKPEEEKKAKQAKREAKEARADDGKRYVDAMPLLGALEALRAEMTNTRDVLKVMLREAATMTGEMRAWMGELKS